MTPRKSQGRGSSMAWRANPWGRHSCLPRPSKAGRNTGATAARRHRPLVGEMLESRTLLTLTPQLLADINPTPVGFNILGPPAEMNGPLYFSGAAGDGNYELWKSDGTTAGTV